MSDEMVDTFMLAGTEEECRSRAKAWAGCADVLSFRHTYFDPTLSRKALPVAYQGMFRIVQGL